MYIEFNVRRTFLPYRICGGTMVWTNVSLRQAAICLCTKKYVVRGTCKSGVTHNNTSKSHIALSVMWHVPKARSVTNVLDATEDTFARLANQIVRVRSHTRQTCPFAVQVTRGCPHGSTPIYEESRWRGENCVRKNMGCRENFIRLQNYDVHKVFGITINPFVWVFFRHLINRRPIPTTQPISNPYSNDNGYIQLEQLVIGETL